MKKKTKLILFDIDGTLISSGGAGVRSLNRAFFELFQVENAFEDIPMAGKTDIQIMKEGLKLHGVADADGNLPDMERVYIEFLRNEINNPMRQIMPGIKEVLDLFKQTGTSLGLLTGNLESGARIKLGPFGLFEYFLDGAYGSDDEDRDNLLPIAVEKFASRGFAFTPGDCIVVGDTPRDVRCAKIHDAYCVAVATGPYSKEELLNTDADIVLDSLSDTENYMDTVMAW